MWDFTGMCVNKIDICLSLFKMHLKGKKFTQWQLLYAFINCHDLIITSDYIRLAQGWADVLTGEPECILKFDRQAHIYA